MFIWISALKSLQITKIKSVSYITDEIDGRFLWIICHCTSATALEYFATQFMLIQKLTDEAENLNDLVTYLFNSWI